MADLFIRDSFKSPSSITTREQWISVLLMLEHLEKWESVYASPRDIIWFEKRSRPMYYITRVGLKGIPMTSDYQPCIYLFRDDQNAVPQHRVLTHILSNTSLSLRSWIIEVSPEWKSWINDLDRQKNHMLSDSLPSISSVLDRFAEWIPYGTMPRQENHEELSQSVDQLLNQIPLGIKSDNLLIPPLYVPVDSIDIYKPNVERVGHLLFWETLLRGLVYVSSESRYRSYLEEVETQTSRYHQSWLQQYRSSAFVKDGSGTYCLTQLYQSVFPKETIPFVNIVLWPMTETMHMVPKPDYTIVNTRSWEPVTSPNELNHFVSQCWEERSECLLWLYFGSWIRQMTNDSQVEMIYIGKHFKEPMREWFPSIRVHVMDPSTFTVSQMEEWTTRYRDSIACMYSSTSDSQQQQEWYRILRQGQLTNCWGMMRVDTTQIKKNSLLRGRMLYEPWGSLLSPCVRLLTNELESMSCSRDWLVQHMIWYNTVCRQTVDYGIVQNRSIYPSRDAQFEQSIIQFYTGEQKETIILDWMRKISIITGEKDKNQNRYCFERYYRVGQLKRDQMIQQALSESKSFEKVLRGDAVDHMFKMLVFRAPSTIAQEKQEQWISQRKRELGSIMGAYAYDHAKYDLLREWLEYHQLTKLSDGVSLEYLKNRHRARVRDISDQIDQCVRRGYVRSDWKPESLLDFGGDKGTSASLLASKYRISKDRVVVTDIDSWYGHKRVQLYTNISYRTLNSTLLPFRTSEFDMIISLMVFHHIEDIETTLRELRRIMKTGGLLFVREHDARDAYDCMAIDVEHSTHELVESQKTRLDTLSYLAYYEGYYRPMKEWTSLLEEVGFEELKLEYAPVKGWTRYITRVYRAVN